MLTAADISKSNAMRNSWTLASTPGPLPDLRRTENPGLESLGSTYYGGAMGGMAAVGGWMGVF